MPQSTDNKEAHTARHEAVYSVLSELTGNLKSTDPEHDDKYAIECEVFTVLSANLHIFLDRPDVLYGLRVKLLAFRASGNEYYESIFHQFECLFGRINDYIASVEASRADTDK